MKNVGLLGLANYNPSREAETGGSMWVWGQHCLHSEFKANQGYIVWPCFLFFVLKCSCNSNSSRGWGRAMQIWGWPGCHNKLKGSLDNLRSCVKTKIRKVWRYKLYTSCMYKALGSIHRMTTVSIQVTNPTDIGSSCDPLLGLSMAHGLCQQMKSVISLTDH